MKTTYIFFDNNFENRTLAHNIKKEHSEASTILFIAKGDSWADEESQKFLANVEVERLDTDGVKLDLSESYIKKIFTKGANSKFFFLSKNESRNTSLAFYIMSLAKELNLSAENMDFYISPDWDEIELFLTEFQYKISRNFEIHLVNTSKLATNILLANFKPVNAIKFDKETLIALEDLNVAVFGFNNNTKEALLRVYQQGRFEGSNFNVDIYDLAVELKTNSFRDKYKGFFSDVNLNLYSQETYEGLIAKLKGGLNKYNLVIIDLADVHLNEKFALELQDELLALDNSKTTLAVRAESEKSILNDSDENPSILLFGLAKDIFNLETIVLENYFQCAKFVNDYYNSMKEDNLKLLSWKGMDAFKKNSNMSVADFNYAFVELIGRDIFTSFKNSNEYRQYLKENPKKYDTLGRIEHLRWMAYLYANGWGLLPLEDDVMVANKDEKRKLHTCLVPFDDLTAVSDMFGEDYKKYDFDNIDIVYDIYEKIRNL